MPSQTHHAVLCNPSWGHCRSQLTFCLRLLRLHPTNHYSLFIPSFIPQPLSPEIEKARLSPDHASRLKVIKYDMLEEMPGDPNDAEADDLLWKRWSSWLAEQVLPFYKGFMDSTKEGGEGHERVVDVVFADGLLLWGFQEHLRRLCQEKGVKCAKMYFIAPVSAAYCATVMMNQSSMFHDTMKGYVGEMDKGGDRELAFKRAVGENNLRLDQLGVGLGPMYIWEMDPNESARVQYHARSWEQLVKDIRDVDFILFWPSVFRENTSMASSYMTVGPQYFWDVELESRSNHETIAFLDRALEKAGEYSVIYIAFGSSFSPGTARQLGFLFEALEKAGLWVLMSRVGGDEEVHETIDEKIAKFGETGMSCSWVPQIEALQHKAVSWFCTHGGSNSAQESMLSGVPMVIWPGGWDQPFIASELVHLGIGIELVQVRTGLNIGRTTARGVLIEGTEEAIQKEMNEVVGVMKSEKGEEMRRKAGEVKELVLKDMNIGTSLKGMMGLGDPSTA